MYYEINVQQNLNVNNHFIPTHEKPRNGYSFVNQLAHDSELYNAFKIHPMKILLEYGFNVSNVVIPESFIIPTQAELKKRLVYVYQYEDFVSPAEMSTLPILPVIFVFIPFFTR